MQHFYTDRLWSPRPWVPSLSRASFTENTLANTSAPECLPLSSRSTTGVQINVRRLIVVVTNGRGVEKGLPSKWSRWRQHGSVPRFSMTSHELLGRQSCPMPRSHVSLWRQKPSGGQTKGDTKLRISGRCWICQSDQEVSICTFHRRSSEKYC